MKLDATNAKPEGRAEFPRIVLKKDEVARINIVTSNDWEVSVRHFVNGLGYVHCLGIHQAKDELELLKIEEDGGRPEHCPMCRLIADGKTDKISPPFRRFAVRTLRYKTNMNGQLSPGNLQFWLELWIIDNYKYRQLRRILEEWNDLRKHDLALTCSDATYQKITIDVKKEACWIQVKDDVAKYWKVEAPKYNLMDCLALSLSAEAIEKKFEILRRRGKIDAPVGLGAEDVIAEGESELPTFGEEIEGKKSVTPETIEPSEDFFKLDTASESVSTEPLSKSKKVESVGEADFLKDLEIPEI